MDIRKQLPFFVMTLLVLACDPIKLPTDPSQPGTDNPGEPTTPTPPTNPPTNPPVNCKPEVVINKQLFIGNLSVVNNERTKFKPSAQDQSHWSFVHLMQELKPAEMTTEQFIEDWLNNWKTVRNVGDFDVFPRNAIETVLRDWPKTAAGKIDLTQAPMRLLGIVFRPDLRNDNEKIAGEGRFVFGVLDSRGEGRPFTIILEYGLPTAAISKAEWFKKIDSLGKHPSFSEAYLTELQVLTDLFTEKRFGKINEPGSYVRVRTNEIALADPWEMRHFEPTATGLRQLPLALTPDLAFNDTRDGELMAWINDNKAAILAGTHKLPNEFLAGAAPVRAGFKWLFGKGLDENVRQAFSKNTCSGCHAGETNTLFLHVNPRGLSDEARLSDFMQAELTVRQADFKAELEKLCK